MKSIARLLPRFATRSYIRGYAASSRTLKDFSSTKNRVFTVNDKVFAAFERTETVEMVGKLKTRPVSDPTTARLSLNDLKGLSRFAGILREIHQQGGVDISDVPLLKDTMSRWHPAFQQFVSDIPSMRVLQEMPDEELVKVSQAAFDGWYMGVKRIAESFARSHNLAWDGDVFHLARYFGPKCEELVMNEAKMFIKRNPAKETQIRDLKNAFMRPFEDHGKGLELIASDLKEMARNWNPESYFAPYTSLVQSSGVGKTRYMSEYGRRYSWSIYVCLRALSSTGYPLRTPLLADLMQLNNDALEYIAASIEGVNYYSSYQEFPHFVYSNLLGGCLRKLRLDFEAFVAASNDSTSDIEFLAQQHRELWWSQQFGSNEQQIEFYGDVRQHALELMAGSIQQYLSSLPGDLDMELEMMTCGSRQLRLQCKLLRSSLVRRGLNVRESYPFLFAFDEASNLLNPQKMESNLTTREWRRRSHFNSLRYVLNRLPRGSESEFNFFAVPTDTMGRLGNFQPIQVPDPSLRYVQSGNLYRPIMDIRSWNLRDVKGEIITGREATGEDVGENAAAEKMANTILQVGRPLWKSLASSSRDAVSEFNSALPTAIAKLINCPSPEEFGSAPTKPQALAVLSSRFGVSVNAVSSISKDMSQSHLSMCFGIDVDEDLYNTRYVVEPMVSLAARKLMVNYPNYSYEKLLPVLIKNLNNNLISTGEIGELTSAVMLVEAHDRAVKTEADIFLGVTVESLFKNLLTDEAYVSLQTSINEQGKIEQWKRIRSARVKLHQVAKLQNRSPDLRDLARFYNVGLYSALKMNHPGVDFAAGLNMASKLSGFLTSVKNDVKGLSHHAKKAPLKSSMFASGLIGENSLQPIADNQFVFQEAVEPYLVLVHSVCPNWAMDNDVQKKKSAIGVANFTGDDAEDLEKKIIKLREKSQKSTSSGISLPAFAFQSKDGTIYGVRPSPDQLVVGINAFNYVDGKKSVPIYRASHLIHFFERLSRRKFISSLGLESLAISDPFVFDPKKRLD